MLLIVLSYANLYYQHVTSLKKIKKDIDLSSIHKKSRSFHTMNYMKCWFGRFILIMKSVKELTKDDIG